MSERGWKGNLILIGVTIAALTGAEMLGEWRALSREHDRIFLAGAKQGMLDLAKAEGKVFSDAATMMDGLSTDLDHMVDQRDRCLHGLPITHDGATYWPLRGAYPIRGVSDKRGDQ